jgi:hypothetical protein
MRRLLSVVLWLAFVQAAFAFSIEDRTLFSIPSNFAICDNFQTMSLDPQTPVDSGLMETVRLFGSITGFVDFAPTDFFLRFVDEYVMSSLQSVELRETLRYHLSFDFSGIESELSTVYLILADN